SGQPFLVWWIDTDLDVVEAPALIQEPLEDRSRERQLQVAVGVWGRETEVVDGVRRRHAVPHVAQGADLCSAGVAGVRPAGVRVRIRLNFGIRPEVAPRVPERRVEKGRLSGEAKREGVRAGVDGAVAVPCPDDV